MPQLLQETSERRHAGAADRDAVDIEYSVCQLGELPRVRQDRWNESKIDGMKEDTRPSLSHEAVQYSIDISGPLASVKRNKPQPPPPQAAERG